MLGTGTAQIILHQWSLHLQWGSHCLSVYHCIWDKEDLCLGDFNWTFLGNFNWISQTIWLVDSYIRYTMWSVLPFVAGVLIFAVWNPYEFKSLTVAPLCLFLRRSTMTARMVHIMWSVESRTMMKTCWWKFMMWFCVFLSPHLFVFTSFKFWGERAPCFLIVSVCFYVFVSFLYHLKLELTNLKCSWRCVDFSMHVNDLDRVFLDSRSVRV